MNRTESDIARQILLWAITGFVTILLMINGYFVKSEFDSLTKMEDTVWQLRQSITLLTFRMDEISKKNKN